LFAVPRADCQTGGRTGGAQRDTDGEKEITETDFEGSCLPSEKGDSESAVTLGKRHAACARRSSQIRIP